MPSWMMATATSCQSRPCLLPSRPYWRYSTSRFCSTGGQAGGQAAEGEVGKQWVGAVGGRCRAC